MAHEDLAIAGYLGSVVARILMKMLTSARADDANESTFCCIGPGAVVYGGITDVTSLMRMFPKSTPVITRFFAQIRPSHDFTTVVLRSVGIAQLQATIQAKRFTAAAFSVRDSQNISPDECFTRRELGFRL